MPAASVTLCRAADGVADVLHLLAAARGDAALGPNEPVSPFVPSEWERTNEEWLSAHERLDSCKRMMQVVVVVLFFFIYFLFFF